MIAWLVVLLISLQQPPALPRVVFETELGTFEVELEAVKAPVTVANFLWYVDAGAYNDGMFHRTVRPGTESREDYPIQVIQASRARGKAGQPPIPLERTSVTGVKHLAGTLSMARAAAPDSASSDFFVCVTDTPELDFGGRRNPDGQGFAAFGRVVSGMDVIKKIQAAPINDAATGRARESLVPPIKILKAYRK
ncbi:MAG: peptidylprolyl isomerase [Acidobacteria bacterium]|nr:MAG: peptidylprolyl isomerase [Acidobacteriota bacterium]